MTTLEYCSSGLTKDVIAHTGYETVQGFAEVYVGFLTIDPKWGTSTERPLYVNLPAGGTEEAAEAVVASTVRVSRPKTRA
jgi:hypothetical protein